MRVALVSAGPSAAEYTDELRDRFDLVIGVNGQPKRIACDYWAFSDHGTFNKHDRQVIGKPRLAVRSTVAVSIAKGDHNTRERFETFGRPLIFENMALGKFQTQGKLWCTWSGTAAIGLAWYLLRESGESEGEVVCYGCEMEGTAAADGSSGARSPGRWHKERFILGRILERMRAETPFVVRRFNDEPFDLPNDLPGAKMAPTVKPPGPRKWQYMMPGGGWNSLKFEAFSEAEFRQLLRGFGYRNHETIEVREVRY